MSTPSPIFILGSPRSGTTLFSLILKQNPELAIPYESHFIVPVFTKWRSISQADFPGVRATILEEIINSKYVADWHPKVLNDQIDLNQCHDLATLINQVFMAYAKNESKQRWADKTPGYLIHVDTLNHLFPTAKFIHLVRDGRDVSLSLLKTHFGPNNFLTALQHWERKITIARKMLAMLRPDRHIEIRYEDLIASPRVTMKQVSHFLELEFHPTMLEDFSQEAKDRVGDRIHTLHSNLLQPLNASSCERWKRELGKADQHLAWKIAGTQLEALGYDRGKRCSFIPREFRRAVHRCKASYRWWRSARKKG